MNRIRPGARVAAGLLALIVAAALLVPALSPYDYATPAWTLIFTGPRLGGGHLFGTDSLGRDLLVRVMWGCRISLLVGVAASLISVVIGVCWGALAGYAGGRLDAVLMRTVDVLYAVPFIPFVIVLEVAFGRNFLMVFIAIGAVSWLDIARIVRGQTLAIREQEYIEAARARRAHYDDAPPARTAKPHRPGGRVRHAGDSGRDPVRGAAELPGPGRAPTARLTRLAGGRGRQ